jgi:hypothetical protein
LNVFGHNTLAIEVEVEHAMHSGAIAHSGEPEHQGWAAVYRLIRALRRNGDEGQIPDLRLRLALLQKQEAKDESERSLQASQERPNAV